MKKHTVFSLIALLATALPAHAGMPMATPDNDYDSALRELQNHNSVRQIPEDKAGQSYRVPTNTPRPVLHMCHVSSPTLDCPTTSTTACSCYDDSGKLQPGTVQ